MGNVTEDDVLVIDDDDLVIIEGDEDPVAGASGSAHAWTLLIVDDDEAVHGITRFALDDFTYENRPLTFISAYSGGEARRVLRDNPQIAVVLLDVVMETDSAGLEVARFIRETLDNRFVRIILRTGQPGQAPERDVLMNYDINDYKSKNELTAQKLFSAVLSSLRAYNQIAALEMSRQGLQKILAASSTLYERRSVSQFVEGVVLQIRSIIQDAEGALLCAISGRHFDGDLDDVQVVAGVAPFAFRCGQSIRTTLPERICREIAQALAREESVFTDDSCTIFFKTQDHAASVIYLCGHRPLSALDRQLLEVFCSKVAIGFDNAHLFERIMHEKRHDGVTGLLNRTAFVERLDEVLREGRAGMSAPPLAVCVLDCDRFRDVNDALGYESGDLFLGGLARRIADALRPGDAAARLGSDQFAVLKRGLPPREAADWAERLLSSIAEPLLLGGREIIPSAAAGLAVAGEAGGRAEDLIADADRAMRGAKRLGGGRFELAASRRPPESEGRLVLVTQLIHALERNQFELHYQPIVRTSDGALQGFEALIRWRHPERGLLSPGAFIGVVEATGLILPVGRWVMEQAVRQLVDWDREIPGADRIQVSVNVSARQFLNHDLPGEVGHLLADTGLAARRLKLEITESLIMTEPEQALASLRDIKALGVRLALDDFGTGYSSLSYLDRFPFDTLKIDRSFVNAMLHRTETMQVVRAICTLADSLRMETVGEGVDEPAKAEALVALGCQWSQGYHFGRPMPAAQAAALIAAGRPGVDGRA